MPELTCDLAQPGTPLAHVWEHTVGNDHAPLALRADWQVHLRRGQAELGFRDVRFPGVADRDPVGRELLAERARWRAGAGRSAAPLCADPRRRRCAPPGLRAPPPGPAGPSAFGAGGAIW